MVASRRHELSRKTSSNLLRAVNALFPEWQLSAEHVMSSWAGLRPLIASSRGGPSDLSRSHHIRHVQPGWWDVAGGKLTTYRLMAEQTVDQIVAWLGRRFGQCQTATTPLVPAEESRGISQLTPPLFSREVVEHFCADEWALHLEDVMMRRSSWHFYCRDPAKLARQAGDWMSQILGWSAEQRDREFRRYQDASDWPIRTSPAEK